MSGLWLGPLLLVVLCLGWLAVQRAWLACMDRPADSDALARPGQCGGSCACNGDSPASGDCARRRSGRRGAALAERNHEEVAS